VDQEETYRFRGRPNDFFDHGHLRVDLFPKIQQEDLNEVNGRFQDFKKWRCRRLEILTL